LLLSGRPVAIGRWFKWEKGGESQRSESAGFLNLLPSYSQAQLTINLTDKWLTRYVWPQFEPVREASAMMEWIGLDSALELTE
jgi:hypothetical protein